MIDIDIVHDPVLEHHQWLDLYRETSTIAASGYPAPLDEEQKEAYLLLPDLLAHCKDAFDAVPEDLRSEHYLLY